MKAVFAALLSLTMLFSFAGCTAKSPAGGGSSLSASGVSKEDMAAAKKEADRYREMLLEKQPSILSIDYTGTDSAEGSTFTFGCKLEYDSMTQTGVITVEKTAEGAFAAQGLMID